MKKMTAIHLDLLLWQSEPIYYFYCLPQLLPPDNTVVYFYCLVIEHQSFGPHDISTLIDDNGRSLAKSTFDWGNALIIPAILAIPSLTISPSRHLDAEGLPAFDIQDLPNVQSHY